jgi:two-component system sensor histidine kinase/response regulator
MRNNKAENKPVEILIVEDSPTQAEKLQYILGKKGYRVIAAPNGKMALEILNSNLPDIVISDIVMPEMDGYELCKRLRADERFKYIPVILVTTLTDPKDVIKGLECGANNFIVSPMTNDTSCPGSSI